MTGALDSSIKFRKPVERLAFSWSTIATSETVGSHPYSIKRSLLSKRIVNGADSLRPTDKLDEELAGHGEHLENVVSGIRFHLQIVDIGCQLLRKSCTT
jgi:hypothetical protein